MKRNRPAAYKGYEFFKNALVMNYRMGVMIACVLLLVQLVIFATMVSLLAEKNVRQDISSLTTVVPACLNPFSKKNFRLNSGMDYKNKAIILSAKNTFYFLVKRITHHTKPFFVKSCFVWLFALVIVWFLKKQSRNQLGDRMLEGSAILTQRQMKQLVKKEKGRFSFGGIPMPQQFETQGMLICGSPGSGKTTALMPVAQIAKKSGMKSIFYDGKDDYVPKLFRQGQDVLFNPTDKKSVRWSIFNDIETSFDIDALAYAVIPAESRESYWDDAPRDILTGGLHFLYKNGKTKNRDIYDFFMQKPEKIRDQLRTIPEGTKGANHLINPSQNPALSFLSKLSQKTKLFEMVKNSDGPFSLKKWVSQTDTSDSNLFLASSPEFADAVRPALTVFLEMLFKHIMQLPNRQDRRICFFIDEFPTLDRLSGLVRLANTGRSKGLCLFLGYQSISQIQKIYGEHETDAILNSCASRLILRTAGEKTAKRLSDEIGYVRIETARENMSWGTIDSRDGGGMQWSSEKQALVLPSTIQNLKNLEGFLKFPEYPHCKIKLDIKSYPDISPGFEVRVGFMLDSIHRSVEIDHDVSVSTENSPQITETEQNVIKQEVQNKDSDTEEAIMESEQHEDCPQPGNPDVYRVW